MLNWRRDPGYEQRMKQLESETEQLRQQNARGRQLLAKINALCFPPESSSTPSTASAGAEGPRC
jgi:hypothetical protein